MPEQADTIRVPGIGRVAVVPDVAVLELGTEARAETVAQALADAGTALTAMVAILREAGATETDLQTAGPSTYTNADETGRIVGYVCSFRLTAHIGDPARAGVLLADVVSRAGDAARMHGISYSVTAPAEHERRARALAVADARDRAEQLADFGGRPLGRLVAISEVSPGGGGPRALALTTAVTEAGVQHIAVSVEATWAFGD